MPVDVKKIEGGNARRIYNTSAFIKKNSNRSKKAKRSYKKIATYGKAASRKPRRPLRTLQMLAKTLEEVSDMLRTEFRGKRRKKRPPPRYRQPRPTFYPMRRLNVGADPLEAVPGIARPDYTFLGNLIRNRMLEARENPLL